MLTLFENSRPIFIEAFATYPPLPVDKFRSLKVAENREIGRNRKKGKKERAKNFVRVETKLRMDTIDGKIDKSTRRCYYRITTMMYSYNVRVYNF